MSDKYIRKPVVFNKDSLWHMEIYKRIKKESDNFSGYVMAILKGHFDVKEELEVPKIKNEQPLEATRITINGKIL